MIRPVCVVAALSIEAATIFGAVSSGHAAAFEAGQRWVCITDQGAQAFMEVHGVEGQAVSFSWGVEDPSTHAFDRLCNKREQLSLDEIKSFCRLLGGEASEGHAALRRACAGQ